MAILVTGANGFLGLNVLDAALEAGLDCVAVDHAPAPVGLVPKASISFELADVRDRVAIAAILKRHEIDAVIHAAAITLAPGSRLSPIEKAFDVNTVSTAILLDESRRAGVARFVYPSSTAVYGAALYNGLPVDEETEPCPSSDYGYTKLAGERLVVEAAKSFGLSCVRVRITALFGPHERQTGSRDLMSLPYQIARAALACVPVRLPAGHARDWTAAQDVAAALCDLATANAPPQDLYTIGIGSSWDPAILAAAIARHYSDWEYSIGNADGSDSGLVFHEDPRKTRQPLLPDRFVEDFGKAIRSPERAAEDYAAWLSHGGDLEIIER